MIRKISLQLAAELMGKDYNFIRIGLQRGLLPFGSALKTHVGAPHGRYSYYISPKLFMDYTGFSEEEIINLAKRRGYSI